MIFKDVLGMNCCHKKQKNMFKAKNPVFSTDPIPSDLLFEGYESYVEPIHCISTPNSDCVIEKLVPHFELAVNMLNEAIDQYESDSQKVQEKIQQNLMATHDELPELNIFTEKLWRKTKVLYPDYYQSLKAMYTARISLIAKRIVILTKLKNLSEYLASHPNYYFIKIKNSLRSLKSLEYQYFPLICKQYHAHRSVINELRLELNEIAEPFPNLVSNSKLLNKMLDGCIMFQDPETKYLPSTDEISMFELFLKSSSAPLDIKALQNCSFETSLQTLYNTLCAYLNIEDEETERKDVLRNVCIRVLFNLLMPDDKDRPKGSKALQLKIYNSRTKSFKELGFIDSPFCDKTPSQFSTENIIFRNAIDNLIMCHFSINPLDSAFLLHKIELQLTGILATISSENLDEAKQFDDIFFMWKALFIASQLPEIEVIFELISKWKKLDFYPNTFLNSCRIPKLVLEKMLTDALS